jgi:hypothetical protein
MALTQEQVDWWFSQNPDATAEDVAAAVKSIGGLEANAGLAGMLANRFSIAEPEVTNYYNAYTAPKAETPAEAIARIAREQAEAKRIADANLAALQTTGATTGITSTPVNDSGLGKTTQTFTDSIVNTPTSQADLFAALAAPADNINSNNGYVKPATRPTSGGVSNVIEGDDIETQIAQLPQEYASWSRSADQRTMELIRKSDGAVLDRRTVGDFSDVDLAKIGLSFIPGAGPILAGLNVADAARTGNWTQAAIGATGLIPGMQNVNTALRVGQAVDSGNTFGAITALAGNTDLQNVLGLNTATVGGFTAKDAMAAGNLVQAATTGNYGAVLTNLGTLTGSSDTTLAGRALSLYTRIQNGDTKALTEAVGLSNSIMNGSTSTGGSTTGSTTGSNITTLTDEDLAELNAGELQAYQSNGVQGLADFRRDMRLLSGLTTSGYTGDGLGGTYTGTDTTGTTTTGTTTTGTTTGTTGTTTTGGSNDTVTVVGASGNDTLTGTDGTTGTTKTVNTKTCPLPNQHWDEDLKMCIDDVGTVNVTACEAGKVRNAAGNCVPINCGAGKHYDAILDTCVEDDVITPPKTLVCEDGFAPNAAGTACIPTVTVTACGPGKVRNAAGDCVPIDCGAGRHFDAILNTCVDDTAIKPTLNCAEGYKPNEAGTECIPVITIEACGEGKVRDPETGECVFPPTTTLNCQAGFKPNAAGTECIPITNDIICSDGYELDETGTKCIPKIVITACGTGKVRDPITGECVPITKDCDPGFHKDANGVCVPDTEKPCDDGYHLENGICVLDDDDCDEGYHRENGVCVQDE